MYDRIMHVSSYNIWLASFFAISVVKLFLQLMFEPEITTVPFTVYIMLFNMLHDMLIFTHTRTEDAICGYNNICDDMFFCFGIMSAIICKLILIIHIALTTSVNACTNLFVFLYAITIISNIFYGYMLILLHYKNKIHDRYNNLIKTTKISQKYINDSDTICAICLQTYSESASVHSYMCDHFFHKECSTEWLNKKNTCPLCRQVVTK